MTHAASGSTGSRDPTTRARDHPAVKEAASRAAKNEGLRVGMSGAAILYIALQKAESLGTGKRMVTVLPDDGMKYLSTDFYDNK